MVQVLNRCFRPCEVISGCHDFSNNIEVNQEKQTAFQKNAYLKGYTYKYILKLHKAQEKMLDNKYTPINWLNVLMKCSKCTIICSVFEK